jgi:sulfate/thiosulfate transport system permease protein
VSAPASAPAAGRRSTLTLPGYDGQGFLGPGIAAAYLTILVLIPIAAIMWRSVADGLDAFVAAVTSEQALAAIRLTLSISFVVMVINVVMGTVLAWVLVRDDFPGKSAVNALIDLPFALPTVVAGLTLLTLYGPQSPFGINVAYSQAGIALALLFITLPFVVRAVQPVLAELDREMEEAAASLGASTPTVIRRIVLPNVAPAMLTGAALGFARSIGEFGSVVLIAGNLPFRTELASVYIFGQVEADRPGSAAAVSVVLLAASLALLTSFDLLRRRISRHDEPVAA